jgi:hypothetical protein
VLLAEGLVLPGEFVDDRGLGMENCFQAGDVPAKFVTRGLQVVVDVWRGRQAGCGGGQALEVVAQVGVLLP